MNIKANKWIVPLSIFIFCVISPFAWTQQAIDITETTQVVPIQTTQKMAENGDLGSQIFLGAFNENHKNYPEAAKWYRKAAEQNNPLGQFRLGELYYAGNGITQDYVEAYKWIKLSLGQKDETSGSSKTFQHAAEKRFGELEGRMNEKQIARAEGLIAIYLRDRAPASQ